MSREQWFFLLQNYGTLDSPTARLSYQFSRKWGRRGGAVVGERLSGCYFYSLTHIVMLPIGDVQDSDNVPKSCHPPLLWRCWMRGRPDRTLARNHPTDLLVGFMITAE